MRVSLIESVASPTSEIRLTSTTLTRVPRVAVTSAPRHYRGIGACGTFAAATMMLI
jgi:hypothetical protein